MKAKNNRQRKQRKIRKWAIDEYGAKTLQDYIDGLEKEILKMKKEGIYVIDNLKMDGLPREEVLW
jgi:hypothetical protein